MSSHDQFKEAATSEPRPTSERLPTLGEWVRGLIAEGLKDPRKMPVGPIRVINPRRDNESTHAPARSDAGDEGYEPP